MIRNLPAGLLCATAMLTASPAFAQEEAESDFLTFEPSAVVQFDLGRIDVPDALASVDQSSLDEFRRIRAGGSGQIGSVGYKFEIDFAASDIVVLDAYLEREFGPLRLRAGNMKTNISLDEETSSRSGNFLERASFTDAFNFARQTGVQARYKAGDVSLWGGVFIDSLDTILTESSQRWSASGRAVWAPKLGETQLHLGASAMHTDHDDDPVSARYRQRPLFHATETRFVDTRNLAISSENFYGVEAAAIAGPFYGAAEYGWLDVSRTGGDALFGGGYVEAGWSVTGEPRAYSGGRFDRAKVASPLTEGGPGGVVLATRYDWIDLDDGPVQGGKQQSLGASLIWTPVDPIRLSVNYTRLDVDGGPFAAAFADGDFSADVIGTRIQLAF